MEKWLKEIETNYQKLMQYINPNNVDEESLEFDIHNQASFELQYAGINNVSMDDIRDYAIFQYGYRQGRIAEARYRGFDLEAEEEAERHAYNTSLDIGLHH